MKEDFGIFSILRNYRKIGIYLESKMEGQQTQFLLNHHKSTMIYMESSEDENKEGDGESDDNDEN